MGNDGRPAAASARRPQSASDVLVSVLFLAVIYICFVGVGVFPARAPQGMAQTGTPDTIRQVSYGGAFLLMLGVYLKTMGLAGLARLFSLPVLLVFSWAALTLLWSPVPGVGARRIILVAITMSSVFMGIASFGAERGFRFVFAGLLSLVVASVIAGFLVPAAIHQPGDPEAGIVGAWRGLFYHKNEAGLVAAACIIWLLHTPASGRRIYQFLCLAACITLLLASQAKTALLLLPLSLLAGHLARLARERLAPLQFFSLFAILIPALMSPVVVYWDQVSSYMADGDSLTGRVAIWEVLLRFVDDHLWTGGGFGSIWGVGLNTPLRPYFTSWTEFAVHGHNGYLDVAASMGIPGLLLCLWAFFLWPLAKLGECHALAGSTRQAVYCLLVFLFAHNLFESNLMAGPQAASWMLLTVLYAVISVASRRPARAIAEPSFTRYM